MDFSPAIASFILEALGGADQGHPADRPDLHGDLPGVPGALGRGLARVHALAVPSGHTPVDLGEAIGARRRAGLIDSASFPEPYDRYDPERLTDIWNQTPAPEGYVAAPTVLIGGPTVGRAVLAEGEVCGFLGAVGLVGDRHLDLAVMHYSIHRSLGAEAVFGFYDAYGSDPNLVLLDQGILTGLLLGWID